ncbi:MAG TPA: FAD-linked oxidase C-terminal domain-containing protein, partial [Porticoccaceae bacterium]
LEFDQPSDGEADVLDFFAHCRARGWLDDGVIAGSERQARQLWRLREDISESLAAAKPIKHDIAVTLSRMPDFIRAMEALLAKVCPGLESIWFGHLGDGNIHLNVLPPVNASDEDIATLAPDVTARVLATVADFGGSISAEHGIGLLKKDYLHYSLSGAEITHLRQLKCLFDPKGVMNPGKVLISG